MGQTLRIIYFILLKETEEKRAMSNSLFLHGPLIYVQWDDNYALFCLRARVVLPRDSDCTCWFEAVVHWFDNQLWERLKADLLCLPISAV